jgi:lysophospholipase L1-like esterase
VISDEEAAKLLAGRSWRRFAGVGDSTVEGVREPVAGYRDESWLDCLLRWLRLTGPDLAELNLGRTGLLAAEVRAGQLARALEFGPDLAVVSAGGNDMYRREFDEGAVAADLSAMVGALRVTGCDVITVGLFDITRAGLIPEKYAGRLSENVRRLSALTSRVAASHDAWFVDLTGHPAGVDPSIYGSDLIHLNAKGHAIAAAETLRVIAEGSNAKEDCS